MLSPTNLHHPFLVCLHHQANLSGTRAGVPNPAHGNEPLAWLCELQSSVAKVALTEIPSGPAPRREVRGG